MTSITVHAADPMGSDPRKMAELHINTPMPKEDHSPDWRKKYAELYQADAEVIADLLESNLPGGTIDALLCRMLTKRASLFRVPLY
jgi:hypothetical protein